MQVLQSVSRYAGVDIDADLSKRRIMPALMFLFGEMLNLVAKTDIACAMNMLRDMMHRVRKLCPVLFCIQKWVQGC